MGIRSLHLAVAVTVAMAAGVSALPASAYKIGGAPWPHGRIPYYNAASWKQPVQDAIRAWNTSGAHVHFVAVSRRRARVVISDLSARSSPETDGEAIIGYNGPGFVNYVLVMSRRQAKAKGRLRDNVTHIDAHELGHTLGLDHPRPGCSVMDSAGIDCPLPRGSWQSRCRLLEKDDIRGAIKLYGGRMRPLGPAYCTLYAPPGPPTGLFVDGDPASPDPTSFVDLRWTNATSPHLAEASVYYQEGTCPARPDAPGAQFFEGMAAEPGRPGSSGVNPGTIGPGHWCFAVFSTESGLYARSSAPATVWMDIPDSSAQR